MLEHARQSFSNVLRKLGSLVASGETTPTVEGQVVQPWVGDAERSYPTVGLTPARALSYLQAADSGEPQMQFELFGEMLQKWPRLSAVEATRRLALTGLDWKVSPTAVRDDEQASQLAMEAAHYCDDRLSELSRFRDVLDHMAKAIGYGISVAELVWEESELIDVVPVPFSRLLADPDEPWRVRVRTETQSKEGVAIDEQPNKWLVHSPRPRVGAQFDGGMLRASMLLYIAQSLSFKDWLIYSQIAGMPIRIAQYESGIPDSDKKALLKMLSNLGTEAVATFSKNIDLKLVEAGRASDRPYQPLQEYCNTEITILWLGQHLTTDISSSGSRAAAEVHDRVREDLLIDDIADEGETIRRDVLTPMVRAKFGTDVRVPQFRRSLVQSVDTKVLADTLAVAINELGLEVPKRWLHQSLGIPEAATGEDIISREGTK